MANDTISGIPTRADMRAKITGNVQRMETDEEFRKSLVDPHPSGNPISIGRRIPTPEDIAEMQVKGARDNKEKWLRNTLTPKKNFKEEALKPTSVERYKNSMRKVIEEDRHAKGMSLVNETEVHNTIKALGSEHYAKGVEARKEKVLRSAKELDSARLAAAATIDAMPTSTEEEREAKMIANKRAMQAIGDQRRGIT
jgi:hypothetical protein